MADQIDEILKLYTGNRAERGESPLSAMDDIDMAMQGISGFIRPDNNINTQNSGEIPETHKAYDYAFDASAKKYGIPKELFYSFLPVENPNADPYAEGVPIENVKSAHFGTKAQGLFQIMPSTAKALDEKAGTQRDPFNPVDNADLFGQHIRDALDRYGEDNYEDAIVDFFSGPQGVILYNQGRGGERSDSNLTIEQYAKKVIDNFKKLQGKIPQESTGNEAQGSDDLNIDEIISMYAGDVPPPKEMGWVGKTGRAIKDSFRGFIPTMSEEDRLYGEQSPNLGGEGVNAAEHTGVGPEFTDPLINEKYKAMAETEGAATAGIKQALETALFVKNPVLSARSQEHPVATTVGTVAGVVAPMFVGGVGAGKAAAELPALTRLASAGRWGRVAYGAVVRGSTAAANWLVRDGGNQILSDNPEERKNAIINLTSTMAGSTLGLLPETFAPKGALQLVLQPAVDALVETGVMASFGKNAWDKENIVNTLSQVVMSALFATNDLKKIPGIGVGKQDAASAEAKPVEGWSSLQTGEPVGYSFKEVDANAKAIENYTNDIEKQQRNQIVDLYRGTNRDQRRAELESGMFSGEPEQPIVGKVREAFGDNIPTKGDVSKRFGVSRQEAATMIKDEYGETFNTPKKTPIEKPALVEEVVPTDEQVQKGVDISKDIEGLSYQSMNSGLKGINKSGKEVDIKPTYEFRDEITKGNFTLTEDQLKPDIISKKLSDLRDKEESFKDKTSSEDRLLPTVKDVIPEIMKNNKGKGPDNEFDVTLKPNIKDENTKAANDPKGSFTKDDIKKKIDEISGGKMIGGQEAMLAGGTAPTGDKYIGSINRERTGLKAEVNKLMEDIYEHYTKNAEADERRPMTEKEIQDLANVSGLDMQGILKRKKGQVWNAVQGKAARDINAASAERVYDLIERNQKKVVDGTITENDKIELMQQWYLHAAVQAEVSKNASQSGRALRMHGFMADAANAKNKIKSLNEIMKTMGGGDPGRGDYILDKLMTLDPNNTAQMTNFARKSMTARTVDKLYEAWISSLLSGVPTQLTNIGSNAVSIAYSTTLEKPTAALLDIGTSLFTGKQRERYLRETPQEIAGMFAGLGDATKAFAATLKSGQSTGPSKMFDGFMSREPAIRGKLGTVIRTPLRVLGAADEFFKTVIYRGSIQSRLYRKARNMGLKGKDISEYIAKNVNDPDEVIREAAWNESLNRTFNDPLGKVGRSILRLRNDTPGARWVVPFIKVPMNIAKFAIERSPIVGQAMATKKILNKVKDGTISKGEIADEAAKSMVGTAISMLVVGLAKSGLITGGGPRDKSERELLYSNGWLPYSFKIGDKYWSYGRMEPIGSIVGIAADFAEMVDGKYDNDNFLETLAPKVVYAFAKNTLSKTFMTSISKAIDAVSEPERYGKNFVQSFASSLVPSIVAGTAKALDEGKLREINSISDAILARIPGASSTLTVKRDVWGNEMLSSSDNWAEAMLSPVQVSETKYDKVDNERLKVGANIGRPSKKITYNDELVTLTPQEYDYYQVVAGKKARKMVEALIKTSTYKRLSKEDKADAIHSAVETARKRVRYDLKRFMDKGRSRR